MPKSETFCSRTVRKDGGYCASGSCIESGDDLSLLRIGFGRLDWVGVDGRLTGPFFFHCGPRLDRGREEETELRLDNIDPLH